MKFDRWLVAFGLSAALALGGTLSGCGGGGSTSSAPASMLTGQFIDGPVKGLCYAAMPSGLSGISNAQGEYQYKQGDSVGFGIPTEAGNCRSKLIELGVAQPVPPAAGNAITSVLILKNGSRVAQVINALNHGTMQAMNVEGLDVPLAEANKLRDYIANGAADPVAALQPVQTKVFQGTSFTVTTPVNENFISTVNDHLQQDAMSLADLPGTLWFNHGTETSLVHFASASQMCSALVGVSSVQNRAITISGKTVTMPDGAVLTAIARDEASVQYKIKTADGENSGNLRAAQPLTLADVKGKTITLFRGSGCAPTLSFSADGTQLTNLSAPLEPAYAVSIDPALPGALKLTMAGGTIRYFALAKGKPFGAGGMLYRVDTQQGPGANEPMFGPENISENPSAPANCNNGGAQETAFSIPVEVTSTTALVSHVQICIDVNGKSICGPNGGFATGHTGVLSLKAPNDTPYSANIPAAQPAARYCWLAKGASGVLNIAATPAIGVSCAESGPPVTTTYTMEVVVTGAYVPPNGVLLLDINYPGRTDPHDIPFSGASTVTYSFKGGYGAPYTAFLIGATAASCTVVSSDGSAGTLGSNTTLRVNVECNTAPPPNPPANT